MRNRGGLLRAAATALLTLAAATPATAQALTPQQVAEADRFALGNAVWILYHEIGHLLVHEFRLPVLGREEDAVDHLATVLLLEPADPQNDRYLIDAVDGFFLSARARPRSTTQRLYYTGHGLDEQRAFEVTCLMIGNDARAFGGLANSVGLPAAERERCPHAYELARSSWFSVLEPHRGGTWLNRPSADSVVISYGPAGPANRSARNIMEAAGVLDAAAQYLARNYVFPRQVALRAEECGDANAYFEPASGDVVICYELVEDFRSLLAGYFEGIVGPPTR